MNSFDDQLKELLRRKEPPNGFSERVIARLSRDGYRRNATPRKFSAPARRTWARWAVALAACLALAIGFGWYGRVLHERSRSEIASKQAMVALHIASTEFNLALEQAQQAAARSLAVQ